MAPTTTTTTQIEPPFSVEESSVALVDSSRPTVSHGHVISPGRALTTLVWAPSGGGRWPLIVFAHGFQVGPQPYEPLLEAWASHGYVVAAPEFPLTDAAVAGANLDESDIEEQPADVRFVTDSLVAPTSPVAARIDPSRVAVAGHSDGAETALAAAVAPPPPGEPAYRALAVFGAQLPPGWPAGGSNPPELIGQGDADAINPPSYGYATWQAARPPRYLVIYKGGGHLPPLEPGNGWYPGIVAASEAFFDVYLTGDAAPSTIAAAVRDDPLLSLQSG